MTRRALTRLTSKDYNRQIPRLIDLIDADLEHADDVLLAALSSNTSHISRWPTDREVSQFLTNTDAYGVVGRARLVMAPRRGGDHAVLDQDRRHHHPPDLTVEHLDLIGRFKAAGHQRQSLVRVRGVGRREHLPSG